MVQTLLNEKLTITTNVDLEELNKLGVYDFSI
jgi:hypothetical protein